MPPKPTTTDSDLRAQVEALTSALQAMQAEMNSLRSQRTSASPAPTVISLDQLSQLSALPKEPHVSTPETFSGKEDLQIYLQQCELCFELQPSRYPNDYHKVGLILSYLRGPVAKWARPYLSNKDHELRKDLSKFKNALQEAFGDPDYQLRAASDLRALKQTESTAKYAAEFQAISSNLSWNDDALYSQFYEGLKKTVQDEVIKFPPKTLRELITLATRIDNHQYQHRKSERRQAQTITITETPPKPPDPGGNLGPGDIADKQERLQYRLANGLCTYCGDPKHSNQNCPKLAKKLAFTPTVSSITLSPITYPPHAESNHHEPR